jgi:hypothetical protein
VTPGPDSCLCVLATKQDWEVRLRSLSPGHQNHLIFLSSSSCSEVNYWEGTENTDQQAQRLSPSVLLWPMQNSGSIYTLAPTIWCIWATHLRTQTGGLVEQEKACLANRLKSSLHPAVAPNIQRRELSLKQTPTIDMRLQPVFPPSKCWDQARCPEHMGECLVSKAYL